MAAADPSAAAIRLSRHDDFRPGWNDRRLWCVHEVMNAGYVRAMPLLLLLVTVGATACGAQTASGAGGTPSPDPHPVTTAPASVRISPGATVRLSALSPPAPRPTGTRTPAGLVTLTTADNGTTIAVRTGQVITVDLRARGVMSYRQPQASGPALARLSASGGYPSGRAAMARFRAVHPGTSDLFSVTDARCLHTTPRCAFPQISWRVTVVVR